MADRDTKGRFAQGNPGGPGVPPRAFKMREREALYKRLAYETVSEEEWKAIIVKAKVDALTDLDGNIRAKARTFIRDTLIGRPAQSIRFDDADDSDDRFADLSTDELRAIADLPDPDDADAGTRGDRPAPAK